jgi:hypothetical protein
MTTANRYSPKPVYGEGGIVGKIASKIPGKIPAQALIIADIEFIAEQDMG